MAHGLPLFLSQFVKRPMEVAALAPSSPALGRAMAAHVPDGNGPVAELGAGTGIITKALLDAGIPAQDLYAVEMQESFAQHLQQTFPDIHVHAGLAQDLAKIAPGNMRAVVSALPIKIMPQNVQRDILEAVRNALAPDGVYIQLTYFHTVPISAPVHQSLGMTWKRTGPVWANLPPASIYVCQFAGH